jgi:hypothetical protein
MSGLLEGSTKKVFLALISRRESAHDSEDENRRATRSGRDKIVATKQGWSR